MVINGKAAAAALVKARAAMKATVMRDAKANYGSYATLAAVMEAITPALVENGLALVQEAELGDGCITVGATLIHESGESIEFTPLSLPLGNQRTPQAAGSAITYGRRYQLTALFGLAPDDDDGAEASKTPQTPQERTNGQQAVVSNSVQRRRALQRNATQPQVHVDDAPEISQDGLTGAQTSQHTTPDAKTPQKPATPATEDAGDDGTPAHQRFFGVGLRVFGPDWDNGARAWVVERWTAKHTPKSVRTSSSKLSDDEKDALADDMHHYASELQKLWQKVKPNRVIKEAA